MLRFLSTMFLVLVLSGCQTGGTDTESTLASAAIETSETQNAEAVEDPAADTADSGASDEVQEPVSEPVAEKPEKPAVTNTGGSSDQNIVKGVERIAGIRGSKGERGAIESIFSCYSKARKPGSTIELAKICAAIDFVVSREVLAKRPASATGTGDRALVISKRHAERIGALLQFKGMSQSQFNTFGKFLHAVAEPAYKKART